MTSVLRCITPFACTTRGTTSSAGRRGRVTQLGRHGRHHQHDSFELHALLGDEQDKELWDDTKTIEETSDDASEQSLWSVVNAVDDEDENASAIDGTAKTRTKTSSRNADGAFVGKRRTSAAEKAQEDELFADLESTLFKVDRDALQIQKADFTVNSVIDKINRGKVNLRPSYQREYVWTVRTASKLIESLILNIPIPTMFFHETQTGKLEVVDGKQRLTSIWSFIQGEFPDGSPFKLTGLEVYEDLNGKTFTDLHERFQETILDYPLNVHTISRSSQPDFVFEVFERLNMGATQLNEQELRNCIYQGMYTDLLEDLVNDEHLLKIYRSKTPHLRMRDRELVLRFFAMLRTTPEGFFIPIKSWLNEEMRENKDMTPQDAGEMHAQFSSTIKLAYEIFGDCAFRPTSPSGKGKVVTEEDVNGLFYREFFTAGEVNVALWDTCMYSLARVNVEKALEHKSAILAAWINLNNSAQFSKLTVSTPRAVVSRQELWQAELDKILKN